LRFSIASIRPVGGSWKAKSMTLVLPPIAAAKEYGGPSVTRMF